MADRWGVQLDAPWFLATVERMADLVVAVDRDALVVYVNPAAGRVLGFTPDEFLGRSCLDFVHPDDLERAAQSLEYGAGSTRAEVPATFRLKTATGWMNFDVRGHGLGTDPLHETSLIVAREHEGLELFDHLLDAMTSSASPAFVNALVARLARRTLWGNQVAVVSWRNEGVVEISDAGFAPDLRQHLRSPGDTPWARARASGELTGGTLGTLDPALAAAAAASGFEAVYAIPVTDTTTGLDACFVAFGPAWLGVNLGYAATLERCGRLLRIAEQQRFQLEQLERTARSDPLTGIANRRRFLHQLDELLASFESRRLDALTVVFADLDDFKPLNDTYGHAAGDAVLKAIARRLDDEVASRGIAARLGGDEFAIVAPVPHLELLNRLQSMLATPIELPNGEFIRIEVSLGAAAACVGDEAGWLLDSAERACYRDKHSKDSPTS